MTMLTVAGSLGIFQAWRSQSCVSNQSVLRPVATIKRQPGSRRLLPAEECAASLPLEALGRGRSGRWRPDESLEFDAGEPGRASHALDTTGAVDPPVRAIAAIRVLDEPRVVGQLRVGEGLG